MLLPNRLFKRKLGFYVRLMVMHEIGLTKYWDLWYPPVSHHCLENMKKVNIKSSTARKPPALTLKNLTGAYIILIAGLSLSLLAFIFELVSYSLSFGAH